MSALGKLAAQAAPGIMGTTTGALIEMSLHDVPIVWVAAISAISVVFGALVHALESTAGVAVRSAVAKGGALWMAAFLLGARYAENLIWLAVIGLGMGLAGEKALDLLKSAVLHTLRKILGDE